MNIIIRGEENITINLPMFLVNNRLILSKIVDSNEYLTDIGYKNIHELGKMMNSDYKGFTFIEVDNKDGYVKIEI